MGLGAFIGVGKSLETALQRVEQAERLGYESAYVTHIAARDSVTTLMAYAARSERLLLGTGVTPIYSRTPVATAQSFGTLDEYSGGRAIIGLGVSHRPAVEAWYGQKIEQPLREMREYVGVVRAILRNEDPPQGETFHSHFHFMGFEPRPDIPIYLAGLAPGMLRLAGEIADGVVLWLCNPEYIRSTVVPSIAEGRAKAGKSPEGFDIVAAVPAAVTSEPDQAKAQLRSELIPYFSLPFYRKMIELSGFGDDLAGFDSDGVDAISDEFLARLAAIGTAEEAEAVVRSYADSGATSPCIGGISKTDFDTTLESLAGCLG
jgi:alkanesulfonate monooxygenase SsuD/methylene tetrahydromethanopterin reductase-like flavin-dependent oxidoreductase (luciferase family)